MKSAAEIYKAVFDLFPNAEIDTDSEGQVIIYTNMREVEQEQLAEMETKEWWEVLADLDTRS